MKYECDTCHKKDLKWKDIVRQYCAGAQVYDRCKRCAKKGPR